MSTVQADTKDWTWVLERPCPECGFDTSSVTRSNLPGHLRRNVAAWVAVLGTGAPELAVRARADRWSTLEYGCHVRDVYRVFVDRLDVMLHRDSPTFPNWDQDATAVEMRYGEQEPAVVVRALEQSGLALARAYGEIREDQWLRTGARSDGARFSVETLGRYLMHDPVHHLWDVGAPRYW